ncbi:putative zinc finger protein [Orchesella cincta]|uniref:Putative zinc finger protein n=1 Tax=Orchesella cincta TaxID=48709 RepID=A0A1D2M3V6_ORCCI|nr:putative zinc finger protein [Orchesella cincta]
MSKPSNLKCNRGKRLTSKIQENEVLFCELCMEDFKTLPGLTTHYKKKHPDFQFNPSQQQKDAERRFKCETFGFAFKKRRMLKDHITIHTSELPHECTICQKKFRRIQNLRLHLKSHLLEKPFKCNICKREFTMACNLKVHRFTHFTDSDKPFLCEICGKGCATSRELKVHKYTHLERKPFECQLCERTFSQQPLMYNHMRRAHLGELPSKCGICGKCHLNI